MKKSLTVCMGVLALLGARVATRVVAQEAAPAKEKESAKISVEIKDAAGEDALTELVKAGKAKLSLDEAAKSSLKDARVSVSIRDVDFERAMQLLANALGLTMEKRDGEFRFRLSRDRTVTVTRGEKGAGSVSIKVTRGDNEVRTFNFSFGGDRPSVRFAPTPREFNFTLPSIEPHVSRLFALGGGKTYTCQHCKKSTTIHQHRLTHLASRECPQCKRAVRSDYKYCPYDGTELPKPAGTEEPKFCPYCGKELGPQPEKRPDAKTDSKTDAKIEEREVIIRL